MNYNVNKQKGAALMTALICLLMVSMMGIISMRTAGTSAAVAANAKEATHIVRMATSALNSFLINPGATWDLKTKIGEISPFPSVVVGAVSVDLQAEYVGKNPCPTNEVGLELDANQDATKEGGECYFFRAASNYVGKSSSEATVTAGFFSRN